MSVGKFMAGFLVGGAVGAVMGILFAPKSGKEMREEIKESAKENYSKAQEAVHELQAKADAIAKKGKAEAEATKASLMAEAEGLEKKAEALAKMNKAGMMQMVIEKLPEMAAAVAKPLEQIDKISIIDSGSGSGVENVGGYVPAVLAKVIESVKETTGFDMTEVMKAETIAARTDRNVGITGTVDVPTLDDIQ